MQIRQINLNTENGACFVKCFEVSKQAQNLIFIMTPIASVDSAMASECLQGAIGRHFNVFALDLPGIGNSTGTAKDFTYANIKRVMLALVEHIRTHFTGPIHFYGGTGTGGLLGQALVSDPDIGPHMTSYSQYGVGVWGDLSILGNNVLLKCMYPFVRLMGYLFPGIRLKFRIPAYRGLHAERENQWYADVQRAHPGAFDFSAALLKLMFDLFLSPTSTMRRLPRCPVLVIAAEHDRYYAPHYVQAYVDKLTVPKKLMWLTNSHLAFLWDAETINAQVLQWAESHTP